MKTLRTTVRLDEPLLRQAKVFAAQHGRTLTSLIADALRELMARVEKPQPRKKLSFPVHKGGRLLPGVDLDNNAALRDLMDGLDAPPRR